MSTSTSTTSATANPVVTAVTKVLADSYALLGQTHVAHWNVEGPDFFSLHTAFQAQYEELFVAIDDIAERIRALGAYSPGGLKNLASKSTISELPIEEIPSKDYVAHLVECNEIVIESLATARDTASEADDTETEDLMIGRIQVHQETNWMLSSFLKNL